MGRAIGDIDLNDISISPKFRVSHWLEALNKENWGEMTSIFIDRIESRFLKPIRLIEKDKTIGEFSGFAILALDCLIIETLHQFYEGIDETIGEHRKAFWRFFKQSKYFCSSFSRRKAFVFYSHFRCGILHQAQTKNKSLVRIGQDRMIDTVTNIVSDGLIVDREKFHRAIENEINSYIDKLRSVNPKYSDLKNNFIKKMNFICGIDDN